MDNWLATDTIQTKIDLRTVRNCIGHVAFFEFCEGYLISNASYDYIQHRQIKVDLRTTVNIIPHLFNFHFN